uniref:glucan 1,4-alpha-glucosidase n=1 Tax=Kwoniella dejecticola CBS 10117 TaxID=1296121 RepID=A0A1A5ZXM8_9TREE|nr:uncharacterized protein I303_07318 [Kwoniella dejecticola CBS 10117]OBR82558.1 hypothetical protein I303_07318 [Kwoniella dejecticola CBS 10117]
MTPDEQDHRFTRDTEEGVPLLEEEKEEHQLNYADDDPATPQRSPEDSYEVILAQKSKPREDGLCAALCTGLHSLLVISFISVGTYWAIHTIIRTLVPLASSQINTDNTSGDALQRALDLEAGRMKKLLMDNIGPRIGAMDGVVVASPSKGEKPDSALAHASILPSFLSQSYSRPYEWEGPNSYESSNHSQEFKLHDNLIRAYIKSQKQIQNTPNPSGDLYDGGLNEPKFHVDGSPFTGSWGRPQRDGPALRALSLIPYAHFLLDRGHPADHQYVKSNLYDPEQVRSPGRVIKNDLEEVANGWGKSGFDLWEEVNGFHFFTLIVSMRSLQAGASLAFRLNDTGAQDFYNLQAQKIGDTLGRFWNAEEGYHLSSLPYLSPTEYEDKVTLPDRQWKDCSLPLSLIHAGDQASEHISKYPNVFVPRFGATDPQVISTLYEYIQSFEGLYKINDGKTWTDGWALGRYREDVYDGVGKSIANPWHICTNAIAQSFYIAQHQYSLQGHIEITDLTRRFWTDLMRDEHKATSETVWSMGSQTFDDALQALRWTGDAFLNVSRKATKEGKGRMSEQIGKDDGKPRGARDLTWSYASFVTAVKARRDVAHLVQ